MTSVLPIPPKKISGLRDIAKNYEVFLVDVVGVVHDGFKAYPGAIPALNALIRAQKTVIFFSNSPRPGPLLRTQLDQLGVRGAFQVFTSGDAARLFLSRYAHKRLFHLGGARNEDILQRMEIKTVETLAEADLVLLSVFIEQDESLTQFDSLLSEIAQRKLPVLCANPDKIAVHGKRVRYCAGTFAERLETLGSQVFYCGKPSLDFYNLCDQTFLKTVPKHKILMIGDTLDTDIEGARRFQIESLWVLTGNAANCLHGKELETFLRSSHPQPTYVSDGLET